MTPGDALHAPYHFEHYRQKPGECVRIFLERHHVDIILTQIEKKENDIEATFAVDTDACYEQASYLTSVVLSYSGPLFKIEDNFFVALRGEKNGNSAGVNYY